MPSYSQYWLGAEKPSLRRFFHFQYKESILKTIIYIDGYNLFYGCLKHSRDKWLDIHKLFFEQILIPQTPRTRLISIKYFTADIKAKVAPRGQTAWVAQQSYLRALQALYPQKICIIKGYYSLEKAKLLAYQRPLDQEQRLDVWKLEEKQTDVNIALEAYRDVSKGNAEQLVFVTNDSDIAPVLEAIREDFSDILKIGVIFPIRKSAGKETRRPANKQLSSLADWTRRHITDEELAVSHLPNQVPTRKRPISKPEYW